jgi:general stress protein 26
MNEEESRQLVWRHVGDIGTCMLVAPFAGKVRARPMRGIAEPDDNAVWFFTDCETSQQVEPDSPSCLAYADVRGQAYVSLSGRIAPVKDKAQIDRLWSEAVETYFPGGKDDPSIQLLRFSAEHGEYWDSPSNPIVLAIRFLQAKITGERPELGTKGQARLG